MLQSFTGPGLDHSIPIPTDKYGRAPGDNRLQPADFATLHNESGRLLTPQVWTTNIHTTTGAERDATGPETSKNGASL